MRNNLLIITINISVILSKKILELNNESFNRLVESNRYYNNKKLLVIFYTKNCNNCKEALNIISNDIIERYKYDSKIDFGKIDCDLKENIWLNIRFNISRIPYIILIKDNHFYELNSNYDKYELDYFINDIKENKDLKRLPDDIEIFQKRIIIFKNSINYFRDYFQYYFNITIHQNIIIFILILLLIVLLLIFKTILEFLCSKIFYCRICRKKDEDLSGISSNLTEEEDDENSDDLSDSIFNEEIDENTAKKKYKEKAE